MINESAEVIRQRIKQGTGANISLDIDTKKLQQAVVVWFSDIDKRNGPYIHFGPKGLKRHAVEVAFGKFSNSIIKQICSADREATRLSYALINSISDDVILSFSSDKSRDNWAIKDSSFWIKAERINIKDYLSISAIEQTCDDVVIPIMAAMAELIGYSEVEPPVLNDEPAWEGALKPSIILRRERNPRNKLLCLRIHGTSCKICSEDPEEKYGEAGSIIEVHHLEPLGNLKQEKQYDPKSDLIPVCPNCHRAMHTRRPHPWTPEEIMEIRKSD